MSEMRVKRYAHPLFNSKFQYTRTYIFYSNIGENNDFWSQFFLYCVEKIMLTPSLTITSNVPNFLPKMAPKGVEQN